MKEVYEIRNIICHDFLSSTHKLKLDFDTISEYLLDTILLQQAAVIICSDKIYSKKIPLENDERIQYFQDILCKKQEELSVIYSEVKSKLTTDDEVQKFTENVTLFEKYLDNDSKNYGRFWFKEIDDGFPFEDLELEFKIKLIEQRISNLTSN